MASILQRTKDLYKNLTQNVIPQSLAKVASNRTLNNIASGNINRYYLPESRNQNPYIRTTLNIAKAVPESVINIPRNLAVGPTRVANEINISRSTGRPLNYTNIASGVAPYAEGAFDLATLGLFNVGKGLIKGAVKEAGKQGFKKAVMTGAAKGAGVGALGGLTYGLDEQYNKNFNLGQVAKGVGAGAALGGVLGGGISSLGALKGLITRPKQLDAQLRDLSGRWTEGKVPVKPPKMPQKQWDFQLAFNKKYNRNPYTPVYQSDLVEASNLEASRRIGMQVRDVRKDKLSTSLDAEPPLYDTKLYHGTSLDEAKAIREGGFKLTSSRRNSTDMPAIYLTKDKGVANAYAVQKPDGGGVWTTPEFVKNNANRQGDVVEAMLSKNAKVLTLPADARPLKNDLANYQKQGYDAIKFEEHGKEVIAVINPNKLNVAQQSSLGSGRNLHPTELESFLSPDVPDSSLAQGLNPRTPHVALPIKRSDPISSLAKSEGNLNVAQGGLSDIAENTRRLNMGEKLNPEAYVEVYHGTSAPNLKNIEKGGFKLGQPALNAGKGDRIYVSTIDNVGTYSKGGGVVKARIKVKDLIPDTEDVNGVGQYIVKDPKKLEITQVGEYGGNLYPTYRNVAQQTVGDINGLQNKGFGMGFVSDSSKASRIPEAELTNRTPLQSADSATIGKQSPAESMQLQKIVGAGEQIPSTNITPASQLGPGNAVQRVTDALKKAKPLRGEQEKIYTQVRRQQAGALGGIGQGMGGEKSYYQKLGQLKGEMPKVEFENIRKQVSQTDVDELFNSIEKSDLTVFEKVTAQTGLAKLFGERGGTVPTEGELKLLNQIFPEDFIEAVLSNRTNLQKLTSLAEGALNLPRAVMATADLSAPLRQGIFLVGRPKQWIPAFKNMFKYAFSEKAYDGLMEGIKKSPNYTLMRESNLALTDMSPSILKREEAFMSNLAEKIPGFGAIAKGSNRAYSGFLNKLRADVFDDLISKAQKQGIPMEGKTLNDLASFINSATGRGNMNKAFEKAAPLLNATFFSPRLMASRLNLLSPVTYVKYDPFVRKEALKSLLTFGGTAMTVLTLSKLAGAEVGTDPRSADFGKIKVGNTRYDILGGFQQYIKLGAQLATGQVVSSQTGKVMTLGEGYKPLTRKDIIFRFFESKEAPIASFVTSLLEGQTSMGGPVDVPTETVNRFVPMVLQDLYELAKDRDSAGQALVMGWPAIFGVGTQTYGKQELVSGKNQIGQEGMQIRPIQGLAETAAEKVFGQRPIGSSSSYNVDTYYQQLKSMPREEAARIFDQISQNDPELAKKLVQVIKDEQKGITVENKTLKEKGVASGDRAMTIAKEFKKAKTQQEKAALWDEYVKKGIITKDVAEQLALLAKQGKL